MSTSGDEREPRTNPSSSATSLFEEYFQAREAGSEPRVHELLTRAGDEREELANRIEVYEELQLCAQRFQVESGHKPPRELGRFQILSPIGSGGIGSVYLAHDPELDRHVALKVLAPHIIHDKEQRAWILNEARSLARLEHPNVVRVFEVGQTDGRDYVVMEHLAGPTLAEVIDSLRSLRKQVRPETEEAQTQKAHSIAQRIAPFSERVQVMRKLANALAYCHDRGVLHRDIKPANILFGRDGEPKFIDFGLAHHSDAEEDTNINITQRLMATPAYAAPEQIEADRTGADPRSDQYSFAVTFYELLTLQNPFDRGKRTQTLNAITLGRAKAPTKVNPSIPKDVERVVLHAMSLQADERYANMSALSADLTAVLENRPLSVAEPSLARVVRLWSRRHKKEIALGLATLTVLIVGLLLQRIGAWTERSDLVRASLDAISVEEFQRPEDFERTFPTLLALRSEVEQFEAHLLPRLVLPRWDERLDEKNEGWSERLGDVIQREIHQSRELGIPFQSNVWRDLIVLEVALCPQFLHNAELRRRGTVELPPAGKFHRQLFQHIDLKGPNDWPYYQPIDFVRSPRPGKYRVQYTVGHQLEHEIDFFVTEDWGRPQAFVLVERRLDVVAQTEEVQASASDGVFAAFYIQSGLVTLEEFRRFCSETRRPMPKRPGSSDQSHEQLPVWTDAASALAYCTWVGGRLPTQAELRFAERQGAIAFEAEHAFGEWTCDLPLVEGPKQSTYIVYHELRGTAADTKNDQGWLWANPHTDPVWGNRDGRLRGTGFRVAMSIDPPAER